MRFNRPSRPPSVEYVRPPIEIQDKTKERRAWLADRLSELQAEGKDARITGTGSYQCISIKLPKERATKVQVQGFCQVCGGQWAIVGKRVAHHGYTRPGDGWQTPSCLGAREFPLSESCDVTKAARTSLLLSIERVRVEMTEIPDTLPVRVRDKTLRHLPYEDQYRTVMVTPEEATAYISVYDRTDWATGTVISAFDFLLRIRNQNLLNQVRGMEDQANYLQGLIERYERGEFVGTTKEVTVLA